MINQFRTLLLNEPADPWAGHEQYIEPAFIPTALDGPCSAFRQILFKSKWPRSYRNFLATQLYFLAKTSPWFQLLKKRAVDTRSTLEQYNTEISTKDSIVLTRISPDTTLQVVGQFLPVPDDGIFGGSWSIGYYSSSSILISDLTTGFQRNVDVTFDQDISATIALDQRSPLWLQFIGVEVVPTGLQARVDINYAMKLDVVSMLQHLQSDNQAMSIFSGLPDEIALRNTFTTTLRPDQQLAIALIAFGLRSALFIQ